MAGNFQAKNLVTYPGQQHMLTATYFTKFPTAIRTKNQTAKTNYRAVGIR